MARSKRIYYGPPGTKLSWKVGVTDAKKEVLVNGKMAHALKGAAGGTIGCALSNMATDPDNAASFGHKVLFAVFTDSTALLVDKVNKDGVPIHAVRYSHPYKYLTDANDRGTLKKLVTEKPDLMERSFTLRTPRKYKGGGPGSGGHVRKTTQIKRAFAHRGALKRAEKAGFISRGVAEQLSAVALANV